MFDFPTIVSSAIGSLLTGVVFLTTAPLWWKWIQRVILSKRAIEQLKLFGVLVACIVIIIILLQISSCMDQKSIPQYHPSLTEEGAEAVFLQCQMKSIEATAGILSKSDRRISRQQYRAACMIEKGYEWSQKEGDQQN